MWPPLEQQIRFYSATNVSRTRQAHQVTACSLFQLLKKAHTIATEGEPVSHSQTFDDWCEARQSESPQFQYWLMILNTELTILTLIRSFRESNFTMYRESLSELIPLLFANNNVNYARWLPIHLK